MSSAFERDGWDGGTQPSVSKDKWVRFAVQKMERGYALIVSEARKSACFFMSGKGYEGCSFKVARQLMIGLAGSAAMVKGLITTEEVMELLEGMIDLWT